MNTGKAESYTADLERAEQLRRSGKPAQAEALLRGILSRDSEQAAANYSLGMLYHLAGRNGAALPFLEKAALLRPDQFEAVYNLGVVLHDEGQLEGARSNLERAVSLRPGESRTWSTLGQVLRDLGEIQAAGSALSESLLRDPANDDTLVQIGILAFLEGDNGAARARYYQALRLNPLNGEAYYRMAMLRDGAVDPSLVTEIENAYGSPSITPIDRILAGYALGFANENLARYETAFHCFREANLLQKKSVDYSFERQRAFFLRHKKALGLSFVNRCRDWAIENQTPIFIIGLPRSGSSLVEQILASHPLVHGAGEVEYSRLFVEQTERLTSMPFPQGISSIAPEVLADMTKNYIRKLRQGAGPAVRITDKLPHNFLRLGLYAALLPAASIVVCERDPRDTCLSLYQHFLPASHGYACDLIELGRYHRLYQDLIDHWRRMFPERIHTVSYEDLVRAPEEELRRLLAHCRLPYAVECLRFHESRRVVHTPSAAQVRKPLYRSSIGRWKLYENQLSPLIESLDM